MENLKTLAIIPARGGSKRIPRKNIRSFLGKPIIAYSIESAKESNCFDQIMVSTDDPEIEKIAIDYNAMVPFKRSSGTANDYAPLSDVIAEVLTEYAKKEIAFDFVCCILATAPLLAAQDIKKSYQLLISQNAYSVVPIVRFSYPIQRAFKIEDTKLQMIWPEHLNSRSNDLEPSFHDAAQFYWLDVHKFLLHKKLFSEQTLPYELPETQVQDIDTEIDWKLAELKYSILQSKS